MVNINWKLNKVSQSNFKKLLLINIKKELKGRHRIIFKKSDRIIKKFHNFNVLIYKGCFYRKLLINRFVNNYKYGEFAYTRKPFRYLVKSKK